MTDFEATRAWAEAQDAADPLRDFRADFHIPRHDGRDTLYFCGNSLGLQPKDVRAAIEAELADWSELAVEAHFRGRSPWMHYHEYVRDTMAEVVGAQPHEVVAMNSLGVNLHLMLVSFYRPTAERPAILMEAGAFPTDRYALESQVRFHGFDPSTDLIEIEPDGAWRHAVDGRDRACHRRTWPSRRLDRAARRAVPHRAGLRPRAHRAPRSRQGCVVGFDLAHAVRQPAVGAARQRRGLRACGARTSTSTQAPGAVAGCFVHERHAHADVPRFAGLVGTRQAHAVQDGPAIHSHPGRGRLATVQSADPGARAAARLAGGVRRAGSRAWSRKAAGSPPTSTG